MNITTNIDKRKEYNLELLSILGSFVKSYHSMRFSQLLINLDMVKAGEDEFYLESEELLQRVRKCVRENFSGRTVDGFIVDPEDVVRSPSAQRELEILNTVCPIKERV